MRDERVEGVANIDFTSAFVINDVMDIREQRGMLRELIGVLQRVESPYLPDAAAAFILGFTDSVNEISRREREGIIDLDSEIFSGRPGASIREKLAAK